MGWIVAFELMLKLFLQNENELYISDSTLSDDFAFNFFGTIVSAIICRASIVVEVRSGFNSLAVTTGAPAGAT